MLSRIYSFHCNCPLCISSPSGGPLRLPAIPTPSRSPPASAHHLTHLQTPRYPTTIPPPTRAAPISEAKVARMTSLFEDAHASGRWRDAAEAGERVLQVYWAGYGPWWPLIGACVRLPCPLLPFSLSLSLSLSLCLSPSRLLAFSSFARLLMNVGRAGRVIRHSSPLPRPHRPQPSGSPPPPGPAGPDAPPPGRDVRPVGPRRPGRRLGRRGRRRGARPQQGGVGVGGGACRGGGGGWGVSERGRAKKIAALRAHHLSLGSGRRFVFIFMFFFEEKE
jgi:hypothetical protein